MNKLLNKKIVIIFGTRPEAIKVAPIINELKLHNNIDLKVCITGQHKEMLIGILGLFKIKHDFDLKLMTPNQTLSEFSSKAIIKLDQYLRFQKPDLVIIQGDTVSVLCTSIVCFYNKIPVAHIEAGLRTFDVTSPWPEEMNRVITSRIAKYHFVPTLNNKNNLLKEGIGNEHIYITGNTVIDSLYYTLNKIKIENIKIKGLPNESLNFIGKSKMILITGHRRENFGKSFINICEAIASLSLKYKEIIFIYPVHLNPNVIKPVNKILGNNQYENIYLIAPQQYKEFIALMQKSYLILTDSGGVQEEAPSLGKPVLVMRDTTERPEAVEAGTVKIIGTKKSMIIKEVSYLIENKKSYEKMSMAHNPYGDGFAAKRIVDILLKE